MKNSPLRLVILCLSIDNSNGQSYDAFKLGQYALANLLYYPVPNAMMGVEFQWGSRENFGEPSEMYGRLFENMLTSLKFSSLSNIIFHIKYFYKIILIKTHKEYNNMKQFIC